MLGVDEKVTAAPGIHNSQRPFYAAIITMPPGSSTYQTSLSGLLENDPVFGIGGEAEALEFGTDPLRTGHFAHTDLKQSPGNRDLFGRSPRPTDQTSIHRCASQGSKTQGRDHIREKAGISRRVLLRKIARLPAPYSTAPFRFTLFSTADFGSRADGSLLEGDNP
ncbi:hypothetical protein PVW48_10870 [Dinoroseobacter sp. PD6]|uniref:hypothetical protein n=1 Tax=Dinoroseobacter sp. PD6 TaxID=3028384 RepID=UPI00237BE275|nr:hypothetical protein [Dinoroseobacter sp. PD6]MDD9717248.1 hypothetical protein [Dinoroseobacter sp. PD6]